MSETKTFAIPGRPESVLEMEFEDPREYSIGLLPKNSLAGLDYLRGWGYAALISAKEITPDMEIEYEREEINQDNPVWLIARGSYLCDERTKRMAHVKKEYGSRVMDLVRGAMERTDDR